MKVFAVLLGGAVIGGVAGRIIGVIIHAVMGIFRGGLNQAPPLDPLATITTVVGVVIGILCGAIAVKQDSSK